MITEKFARLTDVDIKMTSIGVGILQGTRVKPHLKWRTVFPTALLEAAC